MGYDYSNLPKCLDCPMPNNVEERTECALHWRPGTGTKEGFPKEDGWECPKDSISDIAEEGVERLTRILEYIRTKEI